MASALPLVNEILFCPPHYFVLRIPTAAKGDKIMMGQNNDSRRSPRDFSSSILIAIRANLAKIINFKTLVFFKTGAGR